MFICRSLNVQREGSFHPDRLSPSERNVKEGWRSVGGAWAKGTERGRTETPGGCELTRFSIWLEPGCVEEWWEIGPNLVLSMQSHVFSLWWGHARHQLGGLGQGAGGPGRTSSDQPGLQPLSESGAGGEMGGPGIQREEDFGSFVVTVGSRKQRRR